MMQLESKLSLQNKIDLIRNCPEEVLTDKSKLADLIRSAGLYFNKTNMPKSFLRYGNRGLRIWQNPDQLAGYLIAVGSLGINRYVEIGVCAGGTFIMTIEYLKRVCGPVTAIAIDPYEGYSVKHKWALDEYSKDDSNITFIRQKSRQALDSLGTVDLIFIDGCHRFPVVRQDYMKSKKLAKKAIAFHDILSIPDIVAAWHMAKQEDSDTFSFYEFTDLPEDDFLTYDPSAMLGIGLAVRN